MFEDITMSKDTTSMSNSGCSKDATMSKNTKISIGSDNEASSDDPYDTSDDEIPVAQLAGKYKLARYIMETEGKTISQPQR